MQEIKKTQRGSLETKGNLLDQPLQLLKVYINFWCPDCQVWMEEAIIQLESNFSETINWTYIGQSQHRRDGVLGICGEKGSSSTHIHKRWFSLMREPKLSVQQRGLQFDRSRKNNTLLSLYLDKSTIFSIFSTVIKSRLDIYPSACFIGSIYPVKMRIQISETG